MLTERLRKNLKHEARQDIHMEKPLEITLVGLKVGWDGASGNHQGGDKQS